MAERPDRTAGVPRPSWNQAPRIPQLPSSPRPRPVADQRPKASLVGNDMIAGGGQRMVRRPAERALFDSARALREGRQRMIATAAKPPLPPLPPEIVRSLPKNASFNQIAYSVLAIALIAVGSAVAPVINWVFLAYGVLAVLARFPSQIIFISALISLVIVPITSALQRVTLANNFAVMTFYFLLIGLIRAALELRRENRLARSN